MKIIPQPQDVKTFDVDYNRSVKFGHCTGGCMHMHCISLPKWTQKNIAM